MNSLPKPYYESSGVTLFHGDCRAVLAGLEPESIDAVVTDPPAGISFMSKAWDANKGGRREWIDWMANVMAECLRVLKPGGHAFVWALPRTSHWTATALEDAGFEIRDVVMHIFGSGFPKSANIGKAIDKAAGAEREVVGQRQPFGRENRTKYTAATGVDYGSYGAEYGGVSVTAPATPEAQQWDGWGTALKPAAEHWILCRKPFAGTVAANVLEHGTGALNVDGCRVVGEPWTFTHSALTSRSAGIMGDVSGAREGIAESHPRGRWPANILLSHHPECVPVGTKRVKGTNVPKGVSRRETSGYHGGWGDREAHHYGDADGMETVEAWRCAEGCPVAMLDAQSGERPTGGRTHATGDAIGGKWRDYEGRPDTHRRGSPYERPPDTGGASRYFQTFAPDLDAARFRYQAKAPASERRLPDGSRSTHPTQKPVALMRYLARLICPPGGVILDPFIGSGTTAVAAQREGFRIIGIDESDEYLGIAVKRLAQQVLPLEVPA